MSRKLYDYLGIVAMIATPLAAAILFGWELYDYLDTKAVPFQLAIIGGIAGAIAIESVGIFAGHTLMNYIKRRDWRAIIPALAMMFYVYFGYSKVPEYGIVFVLAGFVYVLVALESEAAAVDESEARVAERESAFENELTARKLELEHEERMNRDTLAAQVKLEREKAKAATYSRQETRQETGNLPDDWRQLTRQQRHDLAHLPREERDAIMPQVADRTRREWHRRLDKIAEQNGEYLGGGNG